MLKNLLLFLLCGVGLMSASQQRILQTGTYNAGVFASEVRGPVAYQIYLPKGWSKDSKKSYKVIIGLHGQGTNELSIVRALSAERINAWIVNKQLSEFIFILPRGGSNLQTMQWISSENETLLSSTKANGFLTYLKKTYHVDLSQVAILGHSRGATGALNLAFGHPHLFKNIVSSAFVSDYNLKGLKAKIRSHHEVFKASKLKLKLIIGSKDRYVLQYKRRGSYLIAKELTRYDMPYEFEVLLEKTHSLKTIMKDDQTALKLLNFCLAE